MSIIVIIATITAKVMFWAWLIWVVKRRIQGKRSKIILWLFTAFKVRSEGFDTRSLRYGTPLGLTREEEEEIERRLRE